MPDQYNHQLSGAATAVLPSVSGSTSSLGGPAVVPEDSEDKPRPSLGTATRSRRSYSFRHRRDSTDSDPLSALEHALTPDLETDAERAAREPPSHVRTAATATSIGSAASRLANFEVSFDDDAAYTKRWSDNPRNWPLWYRAWTIFAVSYSTWVVVFYSTSYTASIPGLMAEYGASSTVSTLGVTTYLLGLAAGSLIVAPASELYGRQPVYLVCLFIFTLLVLPCALATSLEEIIIVRFFGAMFGSAMVSNSAGTVVDISTDEYRALAMSMWSIAPLNGPTTGPLIGGFLYQYLGWRWNSWIALILSGVSVAVMATLKETYAPLILQKKAARRRKETNDNRWWCRYDRKVSMWHLIKINLSRPFVLSFTEPILWFFNIWISLIYAILYLCFVAYPIVFSEHRGWESGLSGLAFSGIGTGTMMAIFSEPLIRRVINSHPKDPETGRAPPEASGGIMAIGAVLTAVGQLGFSWTCLPTSIHWAAPIAFGIPFGAGNTLSFIYGSNYLAGAYGVFAASALAGNAVMRSALGGTLPLAGPAMYGKLTPQWAGTLLGLLEVVLIPIPIIFYRYGAQIRAKSKIIRKMREDMVRNENRKPKGKQEVQGPAANTGTLLEMAADEEMGDATGSSRDDALLEEDRTISETKDETSVYKVSQPGGLDRKSAVGNHLAYKT